MDKSFNDEELSDIMKEIEALEEDFSAPTEVSPSPVTKESPKVESKENIVSLDSKPSAQKSTTSMRFNVQGNLTLDLCFDIGGKVVSLEVTETGLSIEIEGGMKFTVPVSTDSSSKKAA